MGGGAAAAGGRRAGGPRAGRDGAPRNVLKSRALQGFAEQQGPALWAEVLPRLVAVAQEGPVQAEMARPVMY